MNETDRAVRMRCSGATLGALGRELQNGESDPAEVISTSVALLELELARLSDLMQEEDPTPTPWPADSPHNVLPF